MSIEGRQFTANRVTPNCWLRYRADPIILSAFGSLVECGKCFPLISKWIDGWLPLDWGPDFWLVDGGDTDTMPHQAVPHYFRLFCGRPTNWPLTDFKFAPPPRNTKGQLPFIMLRRPHLRHRSMDGGMLCHIYVVVPLCMCAQISGVPWAFWVFR